MREPVLGVYPMRPSVPEASALNTQEQLHDFLSWSVMTFRSDSVLDSGHPCRFRSKRTPLAAGTENKETQLPVTSSEIAYATNMVFIRTRKRDPGRQLAGSMNNLQKCFYTFR